MEPGPGSLTFLFTDIEGSTRLLDRFRDAYLGLHTEHQRILRQAWTAFAGSEVSTEGDAFFVVFADPAAALRAAAAAQRGLASHRWPEGGEISVRIGIHTGDAVRIGTDYLGLDVNLAARIAAAGHGGQTLLSQTAAAASLDEGTHLTDLGRHRLRDVGVQHLWQLDVEGLPSTFPPLRGVESHPNNLPVAGDPLIDRAAERAAVAERLSSDAVVTVTGAGGIGKSRLAIETARERLDRYPDGVTYLDLAMTGSADDAAHRLLRELGEDREGGEPIAALVALLRGREALLVLDTADRTVGLPALVSQIATACPRVRILITSRSLLRIAAEREIAVGPLETDEQTGTARPSPAVELFVARAREVRPDFVLTEGDASIVSDICRTLDGVPLAIELAAARIRVLSPAALRDRLARRLPLLVGGAVDAPERQRTLRATIEWSHDQLSADERTMLDRLAVFAGAFDHSAAEAVGAVGPASSTPVVDVLDSLVSRSLVARDPDGERSPGDQTAPRFRLLGMIREFALERLEASPEADAVRESHAEYWLAFAADVAPRLSGREAIEAGATLERHHDEFRSALDWAIEARGGARLDLALRIGAVLGRFWWLHGHVRDGVDWLERILDARALAEVTADDRTAGVDAEARYWAGVLHESVGDLRRAAERLEEALERSRAIDNPTGVVRALNSLGVVARDEEDLDRAEALLTASLTAAREAGDDRGVAVALTNLGIVAVDRARYPEAVTLLAEAVELDRVAGRRAGAAYSRLSYASALAGAGRTAEAAEEAGSALRTFADLGDPAGVADTVDEIAGIALDRGDAASAVRLFLAADGLRVRHAITVRPIDDRRRAPRVSTARAAVSKASIEAMEAEARAMDIPAALALARLTTG
jgi:predicted ATPase/class 3 adenylate cyclase